MLLKRFYDEKLAQASYMVGCQATGEAVVVDPNRDVEFYLRAAEAEKMAIRYVTETHIHADYLSGSRELARRSGATLVLSGEGGPDWLYTFCDQEEDVRVVHDGDELRLGNVRIRILHTPGHTPEHISFMVTDGAASDEPMGVLTGDFVFVGDVGRPDLLEKAAGIRDTMEAGARTLWQSLERFRALPGYLQILPGHGAGSACGKALGAVPTSTLGYEVLTNWAFRCESEDDFVEQVLSDQPEPPVYFAHMKRMNRDGPAVLGSLPHPMPMAPIHLEELLDAGAPVVDLRSREAFAAGHVPGTINIPLDRDFPNWAGWLLPYDRPIYFLGPDEEAGAQAARDLAFIGIDASEGFFGPDALDAWAAAHGGLESSRVVGWTEALRAVEEEDAVLVDVRRLTEWEEGHVDGARHVHLGYLVDRAQELPRDRPILLYCRTGARSGKGMSLLQAHGFPDVRNVEGGVVQAETEGVVLTSG
ncbi:MAG: rhodanese-like domain-containing protein [Gemmatimonadota bacterium]|nr:rhodanese-like domain-containing protein [Gemmatimonadota bacterium]MDH5759684.1 rhodanese-like domain-containing protein [Gemmatimonadota bacterium]